MTAIMLTTRQVAQYLGKKPEAVRYLAQHDAAFPQATPIRGGTMLTFSLDQLQSWMMERQIRAHCELAAVLDANPNTLTTKQVLELLGRSSRDWLANTVKAGHFPKPYRQQRGKQGQNLWLTATVESFLASVEAQTHAGPEYCSRSEVMQILDRQAWTLVQWVKQGRFPAPDIESRTGKPQPEQSCDRWKGLTTQYWHEETLQRWLSGTTAAVYPQGFDPTSALKRLAALRKMRKT